MLDRKLLLLEENKDMSIRDDEVLTKLPDFLQEKLDEFLSTEDVDLVDKKGAFYKYILNDILVEVVVFPKSLSCAYSNGKVFAMTTTKNKEYTEKGIRPEDLLIKKTMISCIHFSNSIQEIIEELSS